jgi:hypothetical protein
LKLIVLLLAVVALRAGAQEIVTLSARPGVTQSFFIASMGERKPEAAALLLIGGRVPAPLLLAFNWSAIKIPLLLVHHVDDQCRAAPYDEAERLGRRFPLITVRGGKRAESGPCEPLSAHGFFGREPETVDAIAGWMLGKPYAREIR